MNNSEMLGKAIRDWGMERIKEGKYVISDISESYCELTAVVKYRIGDKRYKGYVKCYRRTDHLLTGDW